MKGSSKDKECISEITKVISDIPSFDDVDNDEYPSINTNSIKLFIAELGDPNANRDSNHGRGMSLGAQLDSSKMLKEKESMHDVE